MDNFPPENESGFSDDGTWTAPKEHGFSASSLENYNDNNSEPSKDLEAINSLAESGETNDSSYSNEHEQEDPSSRRKKKKNPFEKRIAQLVYEKGSIEQNNSFLMQQLAEKEAYLSEQQRKIQEYEDQLSQKDRYVNEYFEDNMVNQERAIKDRLKKAKEDGDVDREVELIDELAELKSARTTHASWKIQQEQMKQQARNNEDYQPYETSVPNLNHNPNVDYVFQEWVAENQWYNMPRLQDEANAVMRELSNVLDYNNQSHLVGTSEFLTSVSNIMNERYSMRDGSNNNERSHDDPYGNAQGRTPSPVAPVGRGSSGSMAHNYMNGSGRDRVGGALTKEEFEMARYLPRKSNQSEHDLLREYQKAKDYPKSNLQGGSPYRLTIL